jgi:growth arrest-specific protein 8
MTMRYDQLEITVQNLREKLQDAKVKRNMLQIEKDMIHDFYYNTRKEIEEKEAKISNLDTKMQEEEQNHRTQITSYMQKVKHLDYDHLNNCENTQVKAKDEMKEEKKHHTDQEKNNRKQKHAKRDEYERDDLHNIGVTDAKEKSLIDEVETLQKNLEEEKDELISDYEKKLEELKKELDLRMKVEIHEIEERKNSHRNDLMIAHTKSF